ncbi:DUF302 domain-containing protein [Mucilaginibacter sp. X5P1]|uniref:DUF302 domain-containing protein n=1 Tax=Mucilaginibacter sp. X5P1 TaxID=2723088 RepID=UPI0016154D26|nr:DUF302 domain-containing protein [Mucilaginibacter sp. X5P1]MBB6140085.1 uncharacterized protein (DUF302 family) [Mucilaginibacter sp. X5P1]
MDAKGVITRSSPYTVKETIERLQTFLQQKGVTIYARIDQQAEANNAGYKLLPLEYLLFGNPKAGGAIMAANPVAALDLPLKVIAWEDEQQKVWIAFNDPAYIQKRYALPDGVIAPLNLAPIVTQVLQ